jgi:hypothetical protein
MTFSLPIQSAINSDSAEQSKFMSDPVAYLAGKGLSLSDEARNQLENNVRAKAAADPDWGVYIMLSSKDEN